MCRLCARVGRFDCCFELKEWLVARDPCLALSCCLSAWLVK
ncbi:MAG: hypothetical protein QXV60_04780 [Nitrososphaerota archaeon]